MEEAPKTPTMNREQAQQALSLIRDVVGKVHDETVLQRWGIVMVFVAVLNVISLLLTELFILQKLYSPWPYVLLWGLYLVLKLSVCLLVRRQMGGTMTYVEKHIWGNGMTFVTASFGMVILDLTQLPLTQALTVLPAHLAVISAVSFAIIALIHTRFFIVTGVFLLTAAGLGLWPAYGFAVLGIMWFLGLLLPGLLFMREWQQQQHSLTLTN